MSLRDLAALHRPVMLAGANGNGEPMTWYSATAGIVSLVGLFLETPTDPTNPQGIGVDVNFSHATLDVSLADVPGLTRADSFRRNATGISYDIIEWELNPGVGWHLTLARNAESTLRTLR